MDYNKLSTDELEKNFNPRESVENFNHYLEDSLLKSKDVKKQAHIYENIAYGKGPLQKLDIFSKLLLSLSFKFDKLIKAFSTNKCGFGNGLYEIFPVEFRYNLKFL